MIITENLTKHYDDFVAVQGINLNVQAGQVLVLLGPNGAGKTTTVRMLTSILRPTYGKATVAGYDVVHQADQVRTVVGVLTENHGLYTRMLAEDYLLFFAQLYGIERKKARARIESLLSQFGLGDVRKKRLGEFSKGMRQKLALVRVLLHEPQVILLDEPTSALDPESSRTVRNVIHTLKSADRAIILCTHNLADAEELADQIAIIRRGRILYNETPENLKLLMLGPAEYEARLSSRLDDWRPILPEGVELVKNTGLAIRFRIRNPEVVNSALLRQMLKDNLSVISFQEVPRSVEQAYLQAISGVG